MDTQQPTHTVFHRIVMADPALLDSLHRGDPTMRQQVGDLLRRTRLEVLKPHVRGLVEVLAVYPELHAGLRHAWDAQDALFTRQVFIWVHRRMRPIAA